MLLETGVELRGFGVVGGIEQGAYVVDALERDEIVEDDQRWLVRDHAVVGDDDEVDRQFESAEARVEFAHDVVEVMDGGASLFGIGAEVVACVVCVGVVDGDEVRPLRRRQAEPLDDLIDSFAVIELIVEEHVVGGALAGDLCHGTGPEDGCCAHALLLGERPERRAAVPSTVGGGVVVVVVIGGVAGGIEEAVCDDAVVLRIEAGDDGVVVREGERWVGRNHALRRAGSACCERPQMRQAELLRVVVAEGVERDEDDVVFGLLGDGVGWIGNGDDAARRLSLKTRREEQADEKKQWPKSNPWQIHEVCPRGLATADYASSGLSSIVQDLQAERAFEHAVQSCRASSGPSRWWR